MASHDLPSHASANATPWTWVHEPHPVWDHDKARIMAAVPAGVFDFSQYCEGALLPGEWWRVDEGGRAIGYGWVDFNWSNGEVLLAVDAGSRGRGVGSFIIRRLHAEAQARGVHYLYNVIPVAHPEPARLAAWLQRHGYEIHDDGQELRVPLHRRKSGEPGPEEHPAPRA
jgi:GNAT superfamily N-acetyltransferase